MESYFAILDQNSSALSVLQAPVDGNNDSVIKFFGGGVLVGVYMHVWTGSTFQTPLCGALEGGLDCRKGADEKPALNSV